MNKDKIYSHIDTLSKILGHEAQLYTLKNLNTEDFSPGDVALIISSSYAFLITSFVLSPIISEPLDDEDVIELIRNIAEQAIDAFKETKKKRET
jgi:hypothetical protein